MQTFLKPGKESVGVLEDVMSFLCYYIVFI